MEHLPTCQACHVHKEILERVTLQMPDEETMFDLAEVYKVFGDSTRVRILCALLENEMCVCDISALLGMNQSAVSHQLRMLKNHRLVRARRDGKNVFYALDDDHVVSILFQGLCHIREKNGGYSNSY